MKKKVNLNDLKSKSKNIILPFKGFNIEDLVFMFYDVTAVTVAYFFALWFRFDCNFSEIPEYYLMSWMKFAPIYAVISIVIFCRFHLYQSIWKYVSLAEIKRIICASITLAVIHTLLITLLFLRMPISYYIILMNSNSSSSSGEFAKPQFGQ